MVTMRKLQARGVSPSRSSGAVAVPGDLGLSDLSRAVKQREVEHKAEMERSQREADALDMAEAVNAYREDASARFEASAADYDGSSEGFAEAYGRAIDEARPQYMERVPDRNGNRAALAVNLENVNARLRLTAMELEASRRERHVLSSAEKQGRAGLNAIVADPTAYAEWGDQVALMASALPEALRPSFETEMAGRGAAAYVTGLIGADPAQAVEVLEGGSLDGAIEPDVKARALSAAQTEIERRAKQAERAQAEARAQAAEDVYERLEIAGIEGTLTQSLIDHAFPPDSEGDALHYRRMAMAELEKREGRDDAADKQREAVARVYAGEADPATREGREDIDALYDAMLERGGGRFADDPEAGINQALAVANAYGHIPETAAESLSYMAAAGEGETRAVALDGIARLADFNPGLARRSFSASEIATAQAAADLIYAGADPADAAARVSSTDGDRDALLKEGRKWAEEATEADLREAMDKNGWLPGGQPGVAGGPVERARALSLYRTMAAEAYAETGDRAAAKALAKRRMRPVFGVSKATGSARLMAYPPEEHVPYAGDWMAEQFKASAGERLPGAKSFSLVADDRTAAEVQSGSVLPSWAVVWEDENGVWQTLEDRWVFDWTGEHGRAGGDEAARRQAIRGEREAARDFQSNLATELYTKGPR